MTTWVKSVPLDCMTWKQAAAPIVVSTVTSTTVMSMRAGGRRGAAEFLDDGGWQSRHTRYETVHDGGEGPGGGANDPFGNATKIADGGNVAGFYPA